MKQRVNEIIKCCTSVNRILFEKIWKLNHLDKKTKQKTTANST